MPCREHGVTVSLSDMARLRVEIEYELESELWLASGCLANSMRFRHKELDVELRLPPFDEVDPTSMTWGDLNFKGYAGACSGRTGTTRPDRVAVNRLRVIIREDVAGICGQDLQPALTDEVSDLVSDHQLECRRVAQDVSINFLDRLRLKGQTWLGPIGSISYAVAPGAITFEDLTNFRFDSGHGGIYVVPRCPAEADLDSDSFAALTNGLANFETVPLAESFLADADYHLRAGSANDLQRAVLFAAIGCELKVKETLRGKVFRAGKGLVETLISNPRDFSMSTASLFDETMKHAVGHSLKEEDKELYKGIANDLFPRRNKIAHAGERIERTQAEACVLIARRAFAWLDSLVPSMPTE